MQYINPFELLNLTTDNLSAVDSIAVNKAKRKLLAEIELSDNNAIKHNGSELTKSDCLRAIDDLDNRDKKEFHYFLLQNKHFNKFLTSGSLSFFDNYQVESIYKLPDFLDFVSPFFCEQYDKLLSENYKKGNLENVSKILSVKPITNDTYYEKCYKSTYVFLRDIDSEIHQIIKDIEKGESKFINKFSEVPKIISDKVNISLLNLLPSYFMSIRNQLAQTVCTLSIIINNEPYHYYEPAFIIIDIANNFSTDGLVKKSITKSYYTIKKNYEDDLKNEKKERLFSELISKINGKPIDSPPSLRTFNGIGTLIYGDTLYFVFLNIPIFPISRYSLEYDGNNSYRFFGELELHRWQKFWQWGLLVGGIILLIIIGIVNSNNLTSNYSSSNYSIPTNTYNETPNTNSQSSNNYSQPDPPPPPKPVYKMVSMKNGNISGCSKIKTKYDYQLDNKLIISVGNNADVVVKMINLETDKCIRYVYIQKNTTYSIKNIPQAKYYLKIAYGDNWGLEEGGSVCAGKFTTNTHYEKSKEIMDYNLIQTNDGYKVPRFSLKLMDQRFNYLNVVFTEGGMNQFSTNSISSNDFYN